MDPLDKEYKRLLKNIQNRAYQFRKHKGFNKKPWYVEAVKLNYVKPVFSYERKYPNKRKKVKLSKLTANEKVNEIKKRYLFLNRDDATLYGNYKRSKYIDKYLKQKQIVKDKAIGLSRDSITKNKKPIYQVGHDDFVITDQLAEQARQEAEKRRKEKNKIGDGVVHHEEDNGGTGGIGTGDKKHKLEAILDLLYSNFGDIIDDLIAAGYLSSERLKQMVQDAMKETGGDIVASYNIIAQQIESLYNQLQTQREEDLQQYDASNDNEDDLFDIFTRNLK